MTKLYEQQAPTGRDGFDNQYGFRNRLLTCAAWMELKPAGSPKSRGEDYYIKATYQGKEQSMPLTKKIEGLYWVNILFWPGLIVDIVTGKMFKYVPSNYEFELTQ